MSLVSIIRGWLSPAEVAQERERWHGTLNGYTHRRCRCEECKAVAKDYFKRRYAAKKSAK